MDVEANGVGFASADGTRRFARPLGERIERKVELIVAVAEEQAQLMLDDARWEAEGIRAAAREEADRIVREAEARAAQASGA